MSYTPIEGVLDTSWVGSAPYAPPVTIVVGDWREGFASVYPAGFRSSEIGTQFITKQQFVDPLGWDAAVYGTALGTLDWQYVPPYAAIDVSWFGAFSYTPPVLPFAAVWVVGPPAEDSSVYGTGFESSVFGEHLTWWPQSVSPDGLDTAKFGWAAAFREGEYPPRHGTLHAEWLGSPLYAPYEGWAFALWKVLPEGAVWAYGFDHSRFGSASRVWNKRQYIKPLGAFTESFGGADLILTAQGASVGGIAPPPQTGPNGDRQIPSPFIDFRIRYLTPGGIAVPTNQIATTHVIAFEFQFIDLAGRGPSPWVTGNARIEYAVRYIDPPFIASNVFGSHNVARIQVAEPEGWESSFISEHHEFDINLQRLLQHSGEADPAGYGDTHVRNEFEILGPSGWLSQDVNFPIVYNLDQYLHVSAYMDTDGDPTQWPNWAPFVENQHRVLGPGGFMSSRFSFIGNVVENAADPLFPEGLDSTQWGADTFIAYRHREVTPQSWDSFFSTQYAVVYNGAAVVAPLGWSGTTFGEPEQVLNLNRTVKHIFPYGGESVGLAFVAFRVRYLQPKLFYDVPSGFPEVRFNPYPIAPSSIDSYQTGGHEVVERFTTIAPKSLNVFSVPRAGEPIVENQNKTLYPSSLVDWSFGLIRVFNYDTHLTIGGEDLSIWGAHTVSYRTRVMTIAPISVPTFSVLHRVRNDQPDPPALQRILPSSVIIGISERPGIVPSPGIRLNTIYLEEGIDESGYGRPTLTRNTIELTEGIFDLSQCGEPMLIFTRYLYPKQLPYPATPGQASSDLNTTKPRLSPHTVYAPSGDQATQQARQNHGQPNAHRIDQHLASSYGQWSLGGGWPFFGRPAATNQHRSIGPVPNHTTFGNPLSPATRYGSPTLTLRRQYMQPSPIRSLRFGWVIFLNVPQFVSFETFGIHAPIFGDTKIGPPPEAVVPTIASVGTVMTAWGTSRVELFKREITPQGIPHRGNPQQDLTNPWGLPLVGFPREYVWGGYDLTLWGTSRVEHRIRYVFAEGLLSSSLENEDFTPFRDRMRLWRVNPSIDAEGSASSSFGEPELSLYQRTILGRSILSYNTGAHSVAAETTVAVPGWDSARYGDIDRWEAGKIKAHGEDTSFVAYPRLLHPVRPSGVNSSEPGAMRVRAVLSVLGMPEIGFAGPSVTNNYGCTNRVMTAWPVLSEETVPEPELV